MQQLSKFPQLTAEIQLELYGTAHRELNSLIIYKETLTLICINSSEFCFSVCFVVTVYLGDN